MDSRKWWDSLGRGQLAYVESVKNEIAIRISRALAEQGISKPEFARAITVKQAYLDKMLRGDASLLTIHTLARASYVLGINLFPTATPTDTPPHKPADRADTP